MNPLDAGRALLDGLIDDAAQFPPARLPLDQAVTGYLAHRAGPYARLQGRFLCPAVRLGKLPEALPPREHLEVGAVLPPGADGAAVAGVLQAARRAPEASGGRVRVTGLEVPLPADRAAWEPVVAALGPEVPQVYLEVPVLTLGTPAAVAHAVGAVAALRAGAPAAPAPPGGAGPPDVGAKVRCGGVTADAVPPVELVTAFLRACVDAAVPLKATAGLHHPVRHPNAEAGWVMHGFLNVLGGAVLYAAGAVDAEGLAAVVAETDPAAFRLEQDRFAWRDCAASAADVARARGLVHAYGSCSFDEPVDDLVALGLLPARVPS